MSEETTAEIGQLKYEIERAWAVALDTLAMAFYYKDYGNLIQDEPCCSHEMPAWKDLNWNLKKEYRQRAALQMQIKPAKFIQFTDDEKRALQAIHTKLSSLAWNNVCVASDVKALKSIIEAMSNV